MIASGSPIDVGSGWLSWVVVAMVLVAFWAIPIAWALTLFRSSGPTQRKGRHR